ncbi:MAG: FprA family A-type flavoprotein [Clostridia bacterium]|nr:FprA family A-type flavoprotein [Clostridia bacterium]
MMAKDIAYIGVNDHEIDLFEGQYVVPLGMAYNSYVILDRKIAVIDTVDARFGEEWLKNLTDQLAGRKPDYLIVQHMEPDHSANIFRFLDAYPDVTVVASAKAFQMMKNFYGSDLSDRSRVIAAEKSVLNLGTHTLTFFSAPMVHWPEVIFTWDETAHTLFSADAFGKFGALDAEDPEGWACEARRYYFGIVGKYGPQVQAVMKKLTDLPIETICPLHGPVLNEDLGYYLNLYRIWSTYGVESEGVVINYTSVYGHTKAAAEKLAELLKARGCPKVVLNDLARCDMPEAVEDTFRYGKVVLATTTYNADIFPFMRTFIDHLTERNWQKKTVGLIENGTWAPMAVKGMKSMLEGCKELNFLEPAVRITSALNAESEAQLTALADALMA